MKEGWTDHPLGRPPTVGDKIVEVANGYLGQKEVSGNMGFEDQVFGERMKAVGWEKTQAWCAYFAELVWKDAYREFKPELLKDLDKLFSATAVGCWANFNKDKRFKCDRIPQPGDVVIWQSYDNGKPDWRGHAGIVTVSYSDWFVSIEGNTNSTMEREGIEVAKQKRRMLFNVKDGLRLKGFIHPVI